jgi:NAD-dependent deacetylase
MTMKQLIVLTGAGMSAESGVKTFRDAGGLWEGHDVMEVASPQGWENDKSLVLEFYNQRRRQLLDVKPNQGHIGLKNFEKNFRVQIITQNVDDLHERAGSSNVLHLHGELFKVRSTCDENDIQIWKKDLHIGDLCKKGCQLRPHIVWFGEAVPMLSKAIELTQKAAVFVVIGTSLQVYPAAGLLHYVPHGTPIYLIDPKPTISELAFPNLHIIKDTASNGVKELISIINL